MRSITLPALVRFPLTCNLSALLPILQTYLPLSVVAPAVKVPIPSPRAMVAAASIASGPAMDPVASKVPWATVVVPENDVEAS